MGSARPIPAAPRTVRLIPRDEQFFTMFAELAQRITRSATLLRQLFQDPSRLRETEAAIKAVEHEADTLVHEVNKRIDTTFVTPLDREDIHLLAKRLDHVVDLIDGTAPRAVMFRVSETRAPAPAPTDVLVSAGGRLEQHASAPKRSAAVAAHGRQIKQLEEEGDALYHEAVGALFDGDGGRRPDPLEVLKWKELYDKLEEAMDECEDVSNTLESIALKNS